MTPEAEDADYAEPFANIDGVELDGRGGFVVTDYLASKVLQVTATGEARELRQFMPGTADIAFVPAGNVLIVPHMNENKVAAYDLSDVLKQRGNSRCKIQNANPSAVSLCLNLAF